MQNDMKVKQRKEDASNDYKRTSDCRIKSDD